MKKSVFLSVGLLLACSMQAESARDSWGKLVGAKSLANAAYEYVENNPELPNVLIYGDSISIGFTPQVRKALAGKANVYRLYCNGGDSSSVIEKMDRMQSVMRDEKLTDRWTFKWDVIQINVGLHDLKYMNNGKLDIENGKQVFSLDQYVSNLKAGIEYLKKTAPTARLIFATTTPVPADSDGRKEGDASRYNEAALQLLKEYPEVVINDLYSFTMPNQKKWWSKPGNVHFNKEGCAAQGDETARVITKVLEKK
jgi:hypothetical protein